MRTFTMSGRPVKSPLAFRELFSPEDILRDPRLAAAFVMHNIAPLSAWDKFNSDSLFAFAFCWENAFRVPLNEPWDYFESVPAGDCRRGRSRGEMLELRESETETKQLLASIWNMARKIDAPVDTRKRIFCILTASYFLAGTRWEDRPITPEAALLAYSGGRAGKKEDSDVLEIAPGDEPLAIPASRRPYRLVVRPDAPVGSGLSVRKVVVVSNEQGSNVPADIHLYKNDLKDPKPGRVVIPQGDYRYFLLADGVPVRNMPAVIRAGDLMLSRQGREVTLKRGDEILKRGQAEDVISLALDPATLGWVAVTPGGLDYSNHRHGFATFYSWDPGKVLEAAVDGGEWWVLTADGVACSRYGKRIEGLTSLRDVPWTKRK